MKLTLSILTLSTFAAALAAVGCSSEGAPNELAANGHPTEESYDPGSLAAGGNTQHHFQDPNTGQNGISEPQVVAHQNEAIGSPQVVAELHSCGKIPYASLGEILATRGVSTQVASDGSNTAGTLYQQGGAALGMADYAGRVPEAVIASTSSMAKEFDIFVAAAPEVQANIASSPACPGVALVDATGSFTMDAISCLMGKPATAAHQTLANQVIQSAPDVNTGVQLAVAAILEAAHTCE